MARDKIIKRLEKANKGYYNSKQSVKNIKYNVVNLHCQNECNFLHFLPMRLINLSYFFFILLMSCGISKSLKDRPNLNGFNAYIADCQQYADTLHVIGQNQLRKNQQGFWELYAKGDPLERGLIIGSLTQKLLQKQEKIFFSKIEEFVPSQKRQRFLRKFLAWYNRKLYQHVPNEYKTEIYGLSQYTSDDYDHIADNYLRTLYLHGAHDIGHALQDLAMVGCTSFAAWDEKTADGSLIIGRNFDFYVGDDFAQEKIVAFVDPDKGHRFMMVTWPGMIGVVSGMNDQGLTVTINAGKSSIPFIAKTPIAILNREILQYASDIKEAIEIARKREVFVSESILIGSAKDRKAITIEMSPKKFGVYVARNSNQLICANHFQSKTYAKDRKNNKHIKKSHSQYRFDRMTELLARQPKITPQIAVNILRNKDGLNDVKIGYGNEKALNQLLAHHAVVFKPEQRQVWVSSNPYQLGAFVAYDLNKVFEKFEKKDTIGLISERELLISKDSFLFTHTYRQYELFRDLRASILTKTSSEERIASDILQAFKASNPHYWEVYFILGKYHFNNKNYKTALLEFNTALTKEITTLLDKKQIEKYIKRAHRKIK